MSCSTEDLKVKIDLVIGETKTFVVTVKKAGALLDITGWKGYFTAKLRLEDPNDVIRKRTTNAGGSDAQMFILNQTTSKGKAHVFMLPADSKNLKAGQALPFDCWFVSPTDEFAPAIKAEKARLNIKPTATKF